MQKAEQMLKDKKLMNSPAPARADHQAAARLSAVTGYLARHNIKKNMGYYQDKLEAQRLEQ